MLTTRADSCPARLTPLFPASPRSSRAARLIAARVDRMRYRAPDAPHGLSTAHDDILNGRRTRAPWTWLRHADLVSGTVDVWFHVKHDRRREPGPRPRGPSRGHRFRCSPKRQAFRRPFRVLLPRRRRRVASRDASSWTKIPHAWVAGAPSRILPCCAWQIPPERTRRADERAQIALAPRPAQAPEE